MSREAFAFAYIQVELIVEYGEGKRTEDEARDILRRARAFAKKEGLAQPFVEEYDAEQSAGKGP